MKKMPLVSIGVPVYNSQETISACLEGMIQQTHKNIEIIISDNNSTDNTILICKKYQEKDSRIKIYKQKQNIGMFQNFEFVLSQSVGEYFMWAAGDDLHSNNFIEENLEVLILNQSFVSSVSPSSFADCSTPTSQLNKADLTGYQIQRIDKFLLSPSTFHALFYSVIRSADLKRCPVLGHSFWAWDWAVIYHLLASGEMGGSHKGSIVFGVEGFSRSSLPYRKFGLIGANYVFPILQFSIHAWKMSDFMEPKAQFFLLLKLIRLNLRIFVVSHDVLYLPLSRMVRFIRN